MSINKGDLKYAATMASIKVCREQGLLDLTTEELNFLMQSSPWVARDRSLVRRCIEGVVYGALDYVGVQRFAVSAEYVAGAIITFVHPTNYLTACSMMEGFNFSDNVIAGIDKPLKPSELFAHVLHVASGNTDHLEQVWAAQLDKLNGSEAA